MISVAGDGPRANRDLFFLRPIGGLVSIGTLLPQASMGIPRASGWASVFLSEEAAQLEPLARSICDNVTFSRLYPL